MEKTDSILLKHTFLIALAPVIPIPIIDELLLELLQRRMVSELAKCHLKEPLSRDVIRIFTHQDEGRLKRMGFSWIMKYLSKMLKELLRDLFFVWDWIHGINSASHSWYYGYLLNLLFQSSAFDPRLAAHYDQCIMQAKKGMNLRFLRWALLKAIISSLFIGFQVLWWLTRTAWHYLFYSRKKKMAFLVNETDALQMEQAPHIRELLDKITQNFTKGLGKLPKKHLDELRANFKTQLINAGLPYD